MKKRYQVVRVGFEDGEPLEDNEQYPKLLGRLKGNDTRMFVVDNDGAFYPADEFFFMVDVKSFTVTG